MVAGLGLVGRVIRVQVHSVYLGAHFSHPATDMVEDYLASAREKEL